MINYKDTLNMPKTDFEMKANLKDKEPKMQANWDANNIEELVYQKNKNFKKFTIHDGPPYANGNIHIGHALNKILKDIIVRYKNSNKFFCRYLPGWDTHGMPIEIALLKTGVNKNKELSINEKRKNCKIFALDWISKQASQFKRLGLFTSFNNIYKTLDHDFCINELKIFNNMIKKGLIFQELKPIYWSWSSQTSLADAEIEYENLESDSIYVGFKIKNSSVLNENDIILIWTTTPWTIPSNLAIACHPDYEYIRILSKEDKRVYVILKNNLNLLEKLNIKKYEVLNSFKGSDIEKSVYIHPLYDTEHIVITASYVSSDSGTGFVHNAPGFGNDDYLACKKYNIAPFCPIDDRGYFTDQVNDSSLVGKFYIDANEIIIKKLENKKALFLHEKIIHSSAIDWRTKKPVIYRATKQWFVNISKVKDEIVSSLKSVKSVQKNIIEKLEKMILNRQEWCISRQRYWGVPIIIIYDENKNPIYDDKLQDNIINILDKEGIDAWYEKEPSYFLTDNYDKNKKYYMEKDIIDVWFDSGTSFSTMIDNPNYYNFPSDLYLEGKDQFRGWFNSSLINSICYKKTPPYKSILTHGFVLDEKGRKMSKSLGNVISPNDVCEKFGSDILRIWVASSDYNDDVRISNLMLEQTSEIYRKFRNSIFKFILGNLSDFDFDKNATFNFSFFDQYILNELNILIDNIKILYENYNFKDVIKSLNKFTIFLSSWYFEYIKDDLYCETINNQSRRAIQTVLYFILDSYLLMLNPIMPYTCSEAYDFFNKPNKKINLQLEDFCSPIKFNKTGDLSLWDEIANIKNIIYQELEVARKNKIINKNNEAIVYLDKTIISKNLDLNMLKKYLNLAKIVLSNDSEIKIEKTEYNKCLRCWNYFEDSYIKNNELCLRCYNVIGLQEQNNE